ncbi:MAG: PAS domain S-box protein [Gaiellales bacterium]
MKDLAEIDGDVPAAPALLTAHARVLLALAREPDSRLRDLAEKTGLTERTAHRIVSELVASGVVARERVGRRARYVVGDVGRLGDVRALAALERGSSEGTAASERIRAVEAALYEAEERFRTMVENLPAVVYIQDTLGQQHYYVSPGIEGITGYTPEEWMANPKLWRDVIHVQDRARVETIDEQAGITYTPFEAEYRLVRRDGRVIWVHDRSVPTRDANGEVTSWLGVLVDASARRHAEDELQRAEELQRIVIENTSDLVTLIDRSGRHVYASPSTEAVIGYRPDELVGHNLGLLHPDDSADAYRALDLALKGINTVTRFRLRHRDGRWVTIEGSHVGIRDATGLPMVLVVCRDVSEREALDERLREADKLAAVGQLAGGIAHDFNNILTTIIGIAELLLVDDEPADDWRENVEEIRAASDRAASLTSQLLAFSRRQLLRPRVIDLNGPVRDSERMLRRLIGEDIELEVSLEEQEETLVLVDPSQVDQILVNLAVNARQAMPNGGRLAISTRRLELGPSEAASVGLDVVGSYVELVVTDTGEGMSEATLSHVFEPFFTTRESGSGLGLATVYGIAKQSGGHAEVTSEVGRGTSVKVYLPAVEGEPDRLTEGAASTGRGSETVLLVEDEVAVRRLTRKALEGHGYTVLEATSPGHAIELTRAQGDRIDIVVSDVVMPEMNGRELVEQLRELYPALRVLFVSGYDERAVLGAERLPEDVAFLPKPYTPHGLHTKVREVIDAA